MSKMKARIQVRGYNRVVNGKPQRVSSYSRNQYINPLGKAVLTNTIKLQQKEDDWSHRSAQFPNLIGLSDEEVEKYLANYNPEEREQLIEYIKHIKCYNRQDIKQISERMFKDFDERMMKWNQETHPEGKDRYNSDKTIFITSPRGGYEILSHFAYANHYLIQKRNLPYDFEVESKNLTTHTENILKSDSLPYGDKISDVNDIVFIDDLCMSGEQAGRSIEELKNKIKELKVSPDQQPRLHYMAITGDKNANVNWIKEKWDSFNIGEPYSFDYKHDKDGISGVVFPFSIPDGERHQYARALYKHNNKFKHRGW